MRVLFASSEAYPLAKTGGLGDVSAALPSALRSLGADVRLILPGYPQAVAAMVQASVCYATEDFAGFGKTRVISGHMPDTGLPVWLIDCPALFRRAGGLYQDGSGSDWADNALRFAFFSRAAAMLGCGELAPNWRADVVHANDWHTALIPAYLHAADQDRPATVLTIHNLAFQGIFPASFWPKLGLPQSYFTPDGVEYYGQISFLKAGIQYSDRLTTVSPTYAREILTGEFGSGLDGLLRTRRERLFGILNGADRDVWNPATDPHLPVRFGKGGIGGKCRCKTTLQEELQLARDPEAPLLIHVSRLTEQKMSDVLLDALPAILDRGAQFALLGQGDPALERRFVEFARTHHGRMAVRIGYEEPLAHRLHAGADVLLHPSRFEPCGLTQIYAMRYGTLPIVRSIGGLADTVTDATAQAIRAGTATGFAFAGTSAADLIACIDRCLSLFRQPLAWRKIQRRAMEHDFGWENSARMYLELYRELAPNAAAASDPRADEDRQASAVPKVIGARR